MEGLPGRDEQRLSSGVKTRQEKWEPWTCGGWGPEKTCLRGEQGWCRGGSPGVPRRRQRVHGEKGAACPLPSAPNNPGAKVAYLGVASSVIYLLPSFNAVICREKS